MLRQNSTLGEIGEKQVVIHTEKAGLGGAPDGMTIDAEGMLWVAMCHGGLVARVNPDTGNVVQQIEFPCVETTACAFGGPGLSLIHI